jgi:hypothetical protein
MANLKAVKLRVFVVAALLALVPATAAWAKYDSGTYAGKTKVQKLTIHFRATQSRLSKLSIRVKFTCSDGDSFFKTLADWDPQNIASGRYDASFEGTSHASIYRHRGRIVNRTATGTFTGTQHYNADNQLDPKGAIVCRTGLLRYSITKFVAKRR